MKMIVGTKFQLKLTILIFWANFRQKKVFPAQNRKSEHHHWVLPIQISLRTKFHFKQTVLSCGTKFAQKECFWSETEKMNMTIEFCMFKLVSVPNFSLNWQFWFFGPNLPKKSISDLRQNNRTFVWLHGRYLV